jgi:RNA polymerase sigma-70 factor (ECF subfamily)
LIEEPASRTLAIRARSGDGAAFELLARANYNRMYAVARRMMVDASDAEDATQEAFLRGWREIPRLRDPDRYEVWQLRLLVRTCYDMLRGRARRRLRSSVRPIAELVVHPDETVLERERLSKAFARLSAEQRAVVVLHFYRDMAAAEIADVLEIPIGTVHSRLHYGTRALRAALDADERALPDEGAQSA